MIRAQQTCLLLRKYAGEWSQSLLGKTRMLNLILLKTIMRENGMAKGKVKWFSEKKGFGIIESDNDGEVFRLEY